jgi:uncharacterized protein (TIGR03437 family)
VLYAGGAVGLVAGAVQINVQIASGVPSGEQPVVLTISGNSSAAKVTTFIR